MLYVEYSTHLQSCLWTLARGNKDQTMSGNDGVWEVFGSLFLRVGGRLQMANICAFVCYSTQMAEGKQREKREGNSWGVGLRCV